MKALIVEDDRILSNNICESLRHKFEMHQAFDGEEGLNRAFRERFDVIILDVMMPKLDGFEVVARLREANISTPVLMLTALNQSADQVKGLRAGADDYLSKPFELDIFQPGWTPWSAAAAGMSRRITAGLSLTLWWM